MRVLHSVTAVGLLLFYTKSSSRAVLIRQCQMRMQTVSLSPYFYSHRSGLFLLRIWSFLNYLTVYGC